MGMPKDPSAWIVGLPSYEDSIVNKIIIYNITIQLIWKKKNNLSWIRKREGF